MGRMYASAHQEQGELAESRWTTFGATLQVYPPWLAKRVMKLTKRVTVMVSKCAFRVMCRREWYCGWFATLVACCLASCCASVPREGRHDGRCACADLRRGAFAQEVATVFTPYQSSGTTGQPIAGFWTSSRTMAVVAATADGGFVTEFELATGASRHALLLSTPILAAYHPRSHSIAIIDTAGHLECGTLADPPSPGNSGNSFSLCTRKLELASAVTGAILFRDGGSVLCVTEDGRMVEVPIDGGDQVNLGILSETDRSTPPVLCSDNRQTVWITAGETQVCAIDTSMHPPVVSSYSTGADQGDRIASICGLAGGGCAVIADNGDLTVIDRQCRIVRAMSVPELAGCRDVCADLSDGVVAAAGPVPGEVVFVDTVAGRLVRVTQSDAKFPVSFQYRKELDRLAMVSSTGAVDFCTGSGIRVTLRFGASGLANGDPIDGWPRGISRAAVSHTGTDVLAAFRSGECYLIRGKEVRAITALPFNGVLDCAFLFSGVVALSDGTAVIRLVNNDNDCTALADMNVPGECHWLWPSAGNQWSVVTCQDGVLQVQHVDDTVISNIRLSDVVASIPIGNEAARYIRQSVVAKSENVIAIGTGSSLYVFKREPEGISCYKVEVSERVIDISVGSESSQPIFIKLKSKRGIWIDGSRGVAMGEVTSIEEPIWPVHHGNVFAVSTRGAVVEYRRGDVRVASVCHLHQMMQSYRVSSLNGKYHAFFTDGVFALGVLSAGE